MSSQIWGWSETGLDEARLREVGLDPATMDRYPHEFSGGQRQRLAIARAMLKRPRILVFDEATSSLDTKTEQAIQETLREVAKDHTTLVIAHRLSTVRSVDRILVLQQGRIIEQGNHNELMTMGGHYAELYDTYFRHQSPDYQPSLSPHQLPLRTAQR